MHFSPKEWCADERDEPDGMARNSEKEIMSLGQLVRGDLKIRTPLDSNTSNK